ncbi:FAD-dependent monooxygenase [uncultured Sulfuricurvum sp.]|uniref:FAD-dependent monooxygenase n=1 Tax=uncultured Sulfuricurvum sp. TaxID=430693 RepID=UPI002629573D|nr:FAD-dependent monooxygenase [uncultured Sulfuricurvum sp.]
MKSERVLIVGGGVAGLMCKNRLEHLGYRPVLVEKADVLRSDGAGILLGANVLKIFRECALDEALMRYAQSLDEIMLYDQYGRSLGRFDLEKIREETSYPTLAVHRKRLHEILLNSVDASTIRLCHKVVKIAEHGTGLQVTYENGMCEEYDYVIGADGLRSNIRELYVGHVPLRDAGYVCWRFVCDCPSTLDVRSSSEFWDTDGKRVGIFPIGENKIYCFLLSTTRGGEEAMDFTEVLEYFKDFGGDWQHVVASLDTDTTELLYNPIADLSHVALQKGNVILIGDAGHATTPNLGQGAALGIESAYAFGELLKSHPFAEAIRLYPQKRLKRVSYIRNKSHMIGQMAHGIPTFFQPIREFIMRITPESMNQREFERAILGGF